MESVPAALLLFSFYLPLPPPPLEICVVQKELAADRKERFASQGAAGQVIEAFTSLSASQQPPWPT